MVRRLIFALSLLPSLAVLNFSGPAHAAEQFPYQAIVVGEQVDVRCGPGAQFYVTSHAKANDQVTVHRHDHGGWYMISPPPGSFSWIDASLVNPIGSNRGLINVSPGGGQSLRAIVRIGSQLSDDHSFFGRELSNGDEVTILGEKVLAGPSGGKRMLKIVPPAQEFRWVKGEYLVPMSRQIQQQIAGDPYQVPAEHRQRQAMLLPVENSPPALQIVETKPELPAPQPEMKTASIDTTAVNAGPSLVSPPPANRNQQEFAKLDEIDKAYAAMMARDPVEWDLSGIAKSYEDLQKSATPYVSYLVSQRMEAVTRRKEIAEHYQKFARISAETSQRDAQLLAQRSEFPIDKLQAPMAFQQPVQVAMDPNGSSVQLFGTDAIPTDATASNMPTQPVPTPEGVSPQLNGAGILQPIQAPPGFPKFILTSPDGRMLAYVEPGEGVSLEQWVGKPMGVIGRRSREESYGADVIRAQKIVPVQLQP
ncbi:hypothetical protein SH661x_002010 [Planctomicrobium sp. SH661]|uniref:hypothetical protein n=1 Tax=Planctomicrobium sp. SH661 TaxID=3448124 RepID=UPI003F5C146B